MELGERDERLGRERLQRARHEVPVEAGHVGRRLRAGRKSKAQAVTVAVWIRPDEHSIGVGVDVSSAQCGVGLKAAGGKNGRGSADCDRLPVCGSGDRADDTRTVPLELVDLHLGQQSPPG